MKTPPLPRKRYHVIYADPPWLYDIDPNIRFGALNQYSCMTQDDLCDLRVEDIAEDNSVLLLWATHPKLLEALEVVKVWGFRYRTVAFTWIKLNKDETTFMGTGHYARSNAEICLLGTRGAVGGKIFKTYDAHCDRKKGLPVIDKSISSVITTVRNNMDNEFHSVKPTEAMARIEKMFGDVSRIELFSRRERSGWDSYGLWTPSKKQNRRRT